MKAMIFAAGLGTRLKPITDTLPKALVPVCGVPLLEHVVDCLREAGFDDFVVNVHHFADAIIDFVSERESFGAKVSISDERDRLLETGGGILHAKQLLLDSEPMDGSFLVHNVDILSDLDIGWFLAQRREGALATLLVSDRDSSRKLLFDDEMRLVGWWNVSTGEVRSPYPSLDPCLCHAYAFAGIHDVSNSIFAHMEEEGMGERFPIMDFYLRVCDRLPIYGAVPASLNVVDVGKLDTLAKAEEFMLRCGRSCPARFEG